MRWEQVLQTAGYWAGEGLLHVPTSGTSGGRSRTVVRTVDSWADSFAPFGVEAGISTEDVVMAQDLPTSMFVYARAHAAWAGARVVGGERWQAQQVREATVAHLTPTMLRDVVDLPDLGHLRSVVVAGAALSDGVRAAAGGRGLDVVEYYGAAELSFVAIGREVLRAFPQVGVESREGVLWARSPWLALGYGPDVEGPLRRQGQWATVGDRGEVRADADQGDHIVIHGRPGTVNTGGATISTADVEAALRTAPGVHECAVFGLPDERLGEVLVAVVVGGERQVVVAHSRAILPREQRPVLWFGATDLPITAAGKIDYMRLRAGVLAGEVPRWH